MTHLWGPCADMQALRRLCDEHGLFLIEDSAHVIGATWEGKHAGTYGDLGVCLPGASTSPWRTAGCSPPIARTCTRA